MTYQDRNTIVGIITTLLANAYVIYRMFEMDAAGLFDGPDAVQQWARMIAWMIPFAIAGTIAATVLFNILYSVATGDESPTFFADERDRLFEQRGFTAITLVVAIGFLIAIFGLAYGWSALVGLNVIYFAMAIGSLLSDVVKFANYRWAF